MLNKILNILIILIITILSINDSMAYLDNYEQYKGLKYNIMKVHNQEYSDYITNKRYKNTSEYKKTQNNLVKVKTVFDVSQDKLEERVKEKKLSLINKIKTKNDTRIGITEIDRVITKIQKPGKYVVMELPGKMVALGETEFLYLYPHRILGNVDLISKLKTIFLEYKGNKDNEISNSSNIEFKEKLVELLDQYEIKYQIINNQYFYGEIKIGKNKNSKQTKKIPFFISNSFTTPYLETNIEEGKDIKKYIWTYITNEEIEYTFFINNLNGAEVFGKIWNIDYYLGRLSDKDDLLLSKFLTSNLDLYIYKIEKNNFEYIILLSLLLLGIMLGTLLVYNFLENYRNNFKKIPEEL